MFTIPKVSHLHSGNLTAAAEILKGSEEHPIACNNWQSRFPYAPEAAFRIAHNGKELFISFTVTEECTMARIREDNGEVWTDSCVEFFIAMDESGYYNFEFSCIGRALLGFRKERPHAVHASPEIMATIARYPSLGTANFDERHIATPWELTVAIPANALFRHHTDSWDGAKAKMNVYKCGDALSKPHYLSWNPIDTPQPDFHIPRCFREVVFQP